MRQDAICRLPQRGVIDVLPPLAVQLVLDRVPLTSTERPDSRAGGERSWPGDPVWPGTSRTSAPALRGGNSPRAPAGRPGASVGAAATLRPAAIDSRPRHRAPTGYIRTPTKLLLVPYRGSTIPSDHRPINPASRGFAASGGLVCPRLSMKFSGDEGMPGRMPRRSLVGMLRSRRTVTRRVTMKPLVPALLALQPSSPPVLEVIVLALGLAGGVVPRSDQRVVPRVSRTPDSQQGALYPTDRLQALVMGRFSVQLHGSSPALTFAS